MKECTNADLLFDECFRQFEGIREHALKEEMGRGDEATALADDVHTLSATMSREDFEMWYSSSINRARRHYPLLPTDSVLMTIGHHWRFKSNRSLADAIRSLFGGK